MRLSTIALSLSLVLGLCACSNKDVAGTATQTENTVAFSGTVYHANGTPAEGVTVRLAMVDQTGAELALPELVETKTNSKGEFQFEDVPADTFQLAVVDEASGEISYLPEALASEESVEVHLEKGALVTGNLTYNDSTVASIAVGSHFMVYATGLPLFASVFAPGEFALLVPKGYRTVGYCPWDPAVLEILRQSGIADSLIFREWEIPASAAKGDTLSAGTLVWDLYAGSSSSAARVEGSSASKEVSSSSSVAASSESKTEEVKGWISGQVLCSGTEPCDSVEVMVITDLFGFGFESEVQEFDAQARTDSEGRWYLPAPAEIPYDSFRVEYRKLSGGDVSLSGLSRYVKKSELEDLKDTLSIGKTSLSKPSWVNVSVRLVINQEDQSQTGFCFANSVVLGIEGTSHFVRTLVCNEYSLIYLPSGDQKLLLYSGDPMVISSLQEAGESQSSYVTVNYLTLTAGAGQDKLQLTYTPPTVK